MQAYAKVHASTHMHVRHGTRKQTVKQRQTWPREAREGGAGGGGGGGRGGGGGGGGGQLRNLSEEYASQLFVHGRAFESI